MGKFLLVHGAWHGGWCWDRVAAYLRADGHEILAPTLPGLAERAAELGPQTGLAAFIADICDIITRHDWHDITLVGHSFGGAVVRGVHARLESRIGTLVLLDALNPASGQSPFDILPAETARQRRALSVEQKGIALIPVPPLDTLGLTAAADRAWVANRLTGHPLRSFEDRLDEAVRPLCRATYIVCTEPQLATLEASIARARDEGFDIVEMAANHEAMITAPESLARILNGGSARQGA